MQIRPVSELLRAEGFDAPTINALTPNVENYSVLLMQPTGCIEASSAGVRNRDRLRAGQRYSRFLAKALETNADLAITPEYSMPWDVLVEAVKEGRLPSPGKLWAFGCESIRYAELQAIREKLSEVAIVIYEDLEPQAERFVDPLVYVFLAAPLNGGTARPAVLVQFKTHPMADADHFETNALQRGTCIYQFGTAGIGIRLISLICSDVFDFLDADALAIYDRSLIIHIQLNQNPRHEQYRLYRDRLLRFNGDATELICLNWAKEVHEWCAGEERPWNNIAGSAWYLKPATFDDRDAPLTTNHHRGLYYTWLQTLRVRALFFNYEPSLFFLTATKVVHIGAPGPVSRRRGPQLTSRFIWNDVTSEWIAQPNANDGFADVAHESINAKDEIVRISAANPFSAERILALCAGKCGPLSSWHDVNELDSCVIDASEIVRRITFCQDTNETALAFRVARLRRCGHLWHIANNPAKLPNALKDLSTGFSFEWHPDFPHHNAISKAGRRATLIYMGDETSTTEINAVATRVSEFVHRSYSNQEESLAARQRIAVWFREADGQISLVSQGRYIRIDKTGRDSEFDIARDL